MRMSPSCGCCASTCPLCDGAIPNEMSLTISDFLGTGCCTALDGTYFLTRVPGECQWLHSNIPLCVGLDMDLFLELTTDGMGTITLTLTLKAYVSSPSSPDWEGQWSKSYYPYEAISCDTLEGELLDFDSWIENSTFYGDCDETSVQMAISAA